MEANNISTNDDLVTEPPDANINSLLNRSIIKAKISSGELKISNKKGISKVWDMFGIIVSETGEELDHKVVCRSCYSIYKYNGKSTSNLVKHKCYAISKNKKIADLETKKIGDKSDDALEVRSLSNSSLAVSDKGSKQQQQHFPELIAPSTSHAFKRHSQTSAASSVFSNFPEIQSVQSGSTTYNYEQQNEYDYQQFKQLQLQEEAASQSHSINEIIDGTKSGNMAEETTNHHKLISRKRRKKHHRHHYPSSKTLFSAAYDLLQKEKLDEKNPENINLKSFGEYIDTELEKLDKITCADVKMKIHKIIYEAMLKSYKKDDAEVTNEKLNDVIDVDDDDEEIDNDDDDNMALDSDLEIVPSSNAKDTSKRSRENKENKAPRSSVLSERQTSHLTSNAEEQQTKRVKKKRLKSKDILSAVYGAIQTDTKQKTEQTVTFGAYVGNELKSMDNLTVTNAKLKICQILYEASIGKLKNENDMHQANEKNTKSANAEQLIHNAENGQGIRLKEEIIDTNYVL